MTKLTPHSLFIIAERLALEAGWLSQHEGTMPHAHIVQQVSNMVRTLANDQMKETP